MNRILILAFVAMTPFVTGSLAAATGDGSLSPSALKAQAQARVGKSARIPLPDTIAGVSDADLLEAGRTPNYLRAVAQFPEGPRGLALLMKTALFDGAVEPETKIAMGRHIAALHGSPYASIHLERLFAAVAHDADPAAQQLAVKYADALTRDIHGVSNADFNALRGAFNDSQIVELTMTTCFFNYFTRMVEALQLPVEPWALEPAKLTVKPSYAAPTARVSLVTDEEAQAVSAALASIKENQASAAGLGLGFANSQRAFLLSPAFGAAWRNYGNTVRQSNEVSREIKLHVSFAVSMANGCRYCTLHQVFGLRRLGVNPAKLVAMKKDDSALTPRELAAVKFARKLTAEPAGVTDAEWVTLKAEFNEKGAVEVLLQTCAFAFMNRFTDGLHLPSEDEAIKVYKETYN